MNHNRITNPILEMSEVSWGMQKFFEETFYQKSFENI